MTSISKTLLGAAMAAGLTIVPSIAAEKDATHSKSHGHRMMYDKSTEATIKGTVDEVAKPADANARRGRFSTITLKTDSGPMKVALGPARFMTAKNFALAKGDQIEVTGSKVTHEGKAFFLAREVKKGADTLTLRDADGKPAWSAGRTKPAKSTN